MHRHKLYLIETLTNTCVGSGDMSFGTVDILIQKDPVTFLPVFNSSSAKGAIREHMEQFKGDGFSEGEIKFSEEEIKTIFGDETIDFAASCFTKSVLSCLVTNGNFRLP